MRRARFSHSRPTARRPSWAHSASARVARRKPESVKKLEMPRKPPRATSKPWWKARTASRATARSPSKPPTYGSWGRGPGSVRAAGPRRGPGSPSGSASGSPRSGGGGGSSYQRRSSTCVSWPPPSSARRRPLAGGTRPEGGPAGRPAGAGGTPGSGAGPRRAEGPGGAVGAGAYPRAAGPVGPGGGAPGPPRMDGAGPGGGVGVGRQPDSSLGSDRSSSHRGPGDAGRPAVGRSKCRRPRVSRGVRPGGRGRRAGVVAGIAAARRWCRRGRGLVLIAAPAPATELLPELGPAAALGRRGAPAGAVVALAFSAFACRPLGGVSVAPPLRRRGLGSAQRRSSTSTAVGSPASKPRSIPGSPVRATLPTPLCGLRIAATARLQRYTLHHSPRLILTAA